MYNQKLRDALAKYFEEEGIEENEQPLLFGPCGTYDNSIVGITHDHRIVYDYQLMIQELAEEDNITYEEAQEWVDYNTMRALPYTYAEEKDRAPIVINVEYTIEELMERYGE